MNIDKFIWMYEEHEFAPMKDETGLRQLLQFLDDDKDMIYTGWKAYCLATAYHETAHTWLPIEEYGKGKGKPYGEPDKATGLVYYGRGLVQLTWADNYKAMGKLTNTDLYHYPDSALRPELAYEIMSIGMRKGSFTGVGLSKYINGDKTDFVNARRIINGVDCATAIAGYADKFAAMLVQCA